MAGEEARWQLHRNVASNIELVLVATPNKAPTIRPPASHHKNYPSQTNQICRTLLEKQGWAHKWCTPMDPHIWPGKSRTTSSNIHTYSSYVRIWDVALKTCQRRWTIGKSSKRGSGISVPAAWHDEMWNEIKIIFFFFFFYICEGRFCGYVGEGRNFNLA